jgi:class 3 adenylate cyclase/tetratricopeptide (TPR) repeat protein
MMKCPECGCDCPSDFVFCQKCGSKLTTVTPHCGFEGSPDFIITPEDGAPLTGAPKPDHAVELLKRLAPTGYVERVLATKAKAVGERRIVTILFCDVTGSTVMAEALDPEDVMEIMDEAFKLMIGPVMRYEGTVARLMGDAVLAFFGAPIAHEDDPERACRAALDIMAGAKVYARKLEKERGISGFNVRVGINTGLVVVGEVGSDLRVEYTAMGNAINVAARMERAAEPGTTLITKDTHKLIAPLFETESLGPIIVKGKTEPVHTYRVLASRIASGKVRGIAGLDSPLVGREVKIAALQEALARLRGGVGSIVTIVGEAGIGKSRLVAELRKRNLENVSKPSQGLNALLWVEGRCFSYSSSIAYTLWLDVLRGLLNVTAEDAPTLVRDVLQDWVMAFCPDSYNNVYPYLARLMSLPLTKEEDTTVNTLEPKKLKETTFSALEMVFKGAANEQPLVLVCEDIHWADSTSIEVLEHLLGLTDRLALLVICVFRLRREHGSWQLRETVARDYGHHHIHLQLEPLGAEESEMLVGNLLHLEALPQGLRDRILGQGEGNPFYVEEIIRSLINEGAIVEDEVTGHWQATQVMAKVQIPDTLQGLLMARIDRLQIETKRVLQMASVIGRVFLYRVLDTIAEDEGRLDDRLLTLQREELIRERARLPELEYIFKHELTREAAYNGLLKRERRAFHRKVAGALELLFQERIEEQVELLAYHWERAEELENAIHYLLQAAERAARLYANEEAITLYTKAIELAGKDSPGIVSLTRLHRGRGLASERIGEFDQAHADYKISLQLARTAGEQQVEWQALLDMGRLWAYRDYNRTRDYFEEALKLSRRMDDPGMLASSLNWMGNWHSNAENSLKAIEYHQEALEIVESLKDRRELANTLDLLGVSHLMGSDLTVSVRYYNRAIALFRELDDRSRLVSCLTGRSASISMLIFLASVAPIPSPDAVSDNTEALQISEEIGAVTGEAWAYWCQGMIYLMRGNYWQARQLLQSCMKIAIDINHREFVVVGRLGLGIIYLELLNPDLAREQLEKAVSLAGELSSLAMTHFTTGAHAGACLMLDDLMSAQASLERVLSPQTPMDTLGKRYCWVRRGELALAQGDPDLTLDITDRLIASAPGMSPDQVITFLWKLKGEAMAALGCAEEAVPLLQAAIKNAREEREQFMLWRVHASLGRLYLELDRRSEAEKEISTALELVEELADTVPEGEMRDNFLRRANDRLKSST